MADKKKKKSPDRIAADAISKRSGFLPLRRTLRRAMGKPEEYKEPKSSLTRTR